jgi:hypothetical protein
VRASGEAQALALTAKHFRLDPYRLWNIGKPELGPHPRPKTYRNLLYAMAYWLEDRERDNVRLIVEGFGAEVKMDSLFEALTEGPGDA